MSTIVAHQFIRNNTPIPKGVAALARKQFKAKTKWAVGLGPAEMVRGDMK
eukprot:gene15374-37546_t